MKIRYIIGNWKMNKTLQEAVQAYEEIAKNLVDLNPENVVTGLAIPSVFLGQVSQSISKGTAVYAQNVSAEKSGAFTGEISIPMLQSLNAPHLQGSLVGHSERRQYFAENDDTIGKKINALVTQGMQAIYCVGEQLEDREAGHWKSVLETQISTALTSARLSREQLWTSDKKPLLIIAYEPVWAIGTGKNADAKIAQEAHFFIRDYIKNFYKLTENDTLPILYGGSVKPGNIQEYFSEKDIDGALVGGASLKPTDFMAMVKNAQNM